MTLTESRQGDEGMAVGAARDTHSSEQFDAPVSKMSATVQIYDKCFEFLSESYLRSEVAHLWQALAQQGQLMAVVSHTVSLVKRAALSPVTLDVDECRRRSERDGGR